MEDGPGFGWLEGPLCPIKALPNLARGPICLLGFGSWIIPVPAPVSLFNPNSEATFVSLNTFILYIHGSRYA